MALYGAASGAVTKVFSGDTGRGGGGDVVWAALALAPTIRKILWQGPHLYSVGEFL